MNAAIRAVVGAALSYDVQVMGVRRGFHGLIEGEWIDMDARSVEDVIQRGGTILKSARSEQFRTEEGREKALANLRQEGVEALVVIGGDGSLRGAMRLTELGFPTVGVPATIDNDIAHTDFSIGFDTAVNTVVDAINKIRDTASSHERIYVVEVMGRHSGHIALWGGLAGGAESILIPEIPYSMDRVHERIVQGQMEGRAHSIIVVAEGLDGLANASVQESAGFRIGRIVRERTGSEVRITILGHIQRGGAPTASDRILASRLGSEAARLALLGVGGKMVGIRNGKIEAIDIEKALKAPRTIDDTDLYSLAEMLSAV